MTNPTINRPLQFYGRPVDLAGRAPDTIVCRRVGSCTCNE